jgi:hypothetical protein
MPASPENRQRVLDIIKAFKITEQYVFMLEHLVPSHFNFKKTVEYKKWTDIRHYMMHQVNNWRSL